LLDKGRGKPAAEAWLKYLRSDKAKTIITSASATNSDSRAGIRQTRRSIPSMFSPSDLAAIWLTLKLATVTTLLLLLIGTPIAWWLARTRSWWKGPVGAVVALPIVLPPTVLGFYLLLLMGPDGPVGRFTEWAGIGLLPFTFWGLVVASVFYSMPFVVQPLQNAFEAIGERPLEAAATLRASPLDAFFSVAVPLAKPGFLTATILGFAHTVGEFGVVLMIGGNIPDKTRVVSVQIYDHVEALEYAPAHWLAGGMVAFSFLVLLALYTAEPDRAAQQADEHHRPLPFGLARASRSTSTSTCRAAASPRCSAGRAAARPRCCAASPGWNAARDG
jgi:molybdate transport system permease protein